MIEDTTINGQLQAHKVSKDVRRTLSNQPVEVLVAGSLNSKVAAANLVSSLIVNHETAVRVLQGGVSGEDRVVWLNNGGGVLRSRVNDEFELGLLAIVHRKTLHEESTETRSSTTAKGVENQESLETGAVVRHSPDAVKNLVNHLLANGVVATSVVVRSILLACDHLFRVEKVAVGASADFVDDIGLEIAVDRSGDVFSLAYNAATNALVNSAADCNNIYAYQFQKRMC